MQWLEPTIFFALGTIVASFIGVVAARLHTGQGFLGGRSRCDACGTPLLARSLVPIFSFMGSGGRAGCCGARLSWYAPGTELLLGALFVLAYLKLGFTSEFPLVLLAFSLLLLLVVYDSMHHMLPPVPLGLFVAVSALIAVMATSSLTDFMLRAASAAGPAVFLLAIHVVSRGRAMGLADVPLAFGLGLLTGSAAIPGLIFSFWIGALVGITLLLARPRGSRLNTEVPFAPFLAAGFLLAYFTQWNPFALATLLY